MWNSNQPPRREFVFPLNIQDTPIGNELVFNLARLHIFHLWSNFVQIQDPPNFEFFNLNFTRLKNMKIAKKKMMIWIRVIFHSLAVFFKIPFIVQWIMFDVCNLIISIYLSNSTIFEDSDLSGMFLQSVSQKCSNKSVAMKVSKLLFISQNLQNFLIRTSVISWIFFHLSLEYLCIVF